MQCSKQEIFLAIASGDFIVIDVEKEYEIVSEKMAQEQLTSNLNQHDPNPNKLILGHPGKGMAFHPEDYDHCKNTEDIKAKFLLLRKELPDEDDIQTICEFYHINLANNKFGEEADKIPSLLD